MAIRRRPHADAPLQAFLGDGEFVVAAEVERILYANGWFRGTQQNISRNNLVATPTFDENFNLVGIDSQYLNFAVLSFMKSPVQIVE